MNTRTTGTLLVLAAVACGGGTQAPVEISGMSPQAGAATAAKAVCTHAAQCGGYSIECMGGGTAGGSGGEGAATSTPGPAVFEPVDFDKCFEDASGDIAQLL